MSPDVRFIAIFFFINKIWCSNYVAPNENSVLVHFMDIKNEEFVKVLPSLVKTIAKSANEFCEYQVSSCGNLKNFNITSLNIKFVGSNEKEKYLESTRFVLTNIYIDNEGANEELSVMPKPLAIEFFKKHRDEIVKNGNVQIAYIENELVYPQRNNLDNYLIIPISCAFCIILIVLNLICQIKTSKKVKQKLGNEVNELKPLIQEPKISSPNSQRLEPKPDKTSILSRHDSFDQKLDTKTENKRRKKDRNMVAGSVGSGIGSPRNMTDNLESYSVNPNGDVQIPITFDQRISADSRVAYRLASN